MPARCVGTAAPSMCKRVPPCDASPPAPTLAFGWARHFRARAAKVQVLGLASLSPSLCLCFASLRAARAREQNSTLSGLLPTDTKRGAAHRGHRKESPPCATDFSLRQLFTSLSEVTYLPVAGVVPRSVSIAIRQCTTSLEHYVVTMDD